MDDRPTAPETMAQLTAERNRFAARVHELEADQRQANEMLAQARERLSEFERRGGKQAERAKLEQQLAEAKSAAEEPWPERIEGTRRASRDAQAKVQRFAAENLPELVAALEADGQIAADRINAAATEMLVSQQAWEQAAQEIGALLSLLGPVSPSDVSRTRCEQLAQEASRLLREGGETGPVLRRDHPRTPDAEPEPEPQSEPAAAA
jgi:chromosome segregation ATPase